MKKILALLAAAGLMLGSLNAAAAAANYSDTWWNPQEVGTGLQMVQQGETAFVTLYTYGSNNEPLWLVASDARVYAYTSSGRPAFRGTLYRTRGTPFSDTHRNADTQTIPVGEIFLTATDDNALAIQYTVNNITVAKQLERLTFSRTGGAGNYIGSFTLRLSPNDTSPPYGTREYNADFLLIIGEGDQAVLRVEEPIGGLCDYRGPYTQAGRYGSFAGSYTCLTGDSGQFQVAQLEFTDGGVTGTLNLAGRDGLGRGRFGAVRR
ncbi:hypothetical protein DSM104443_04193 [Usitatibacter rugosus]|uniref:Uncharacterized protein n=1 Tax=Usitatibacter rugosus TaxID=2732067 RepID=A0A6M4H0S0_9PROT|nr:hypothetical protein [Usitatibacter rugosus]QJR13099.1 hypothetical protein DSM104443_04193 [Usitatibacter rugosus]